MQDSANTTPDQATLWNGRAGHAWVDAQALLDQMFEPFELALASAASRASATRVLDIGCGTGATTLAVARGLTAGAQCTGVDISAPMIDAARARSAEQAATVRFVCADAQSHDFAAASFDRVISRFGVMFFADPVAAFTNLRRATRAGGALHCIVFRSAGDNPFMTTAERAAAPYFPEMPARKAGGPGQFAFADRDHVHAILSESGWSEIAIEPLDVVCSFPERELVRYFTRLGPVGPLLDSADEAIRGELIATVRRAFDPFVHGDEVRFAAGCWTIRAQ